ncbi:HesA/MoeB/ThiF family protein [Asticcacaulis machinosus]|uniref:ThiF family adenylyltransferase n=1 Tax=Asticcacaulis machinosus TaxID=2984211 RepID=A0ABT5HGG8_9CAUL|nr:ThiF family adenylyltransferase [Asticcacaulis machinosus]MDC7675191.1 ThiF family adenylyltransferase [Asticcacaulis machinosus]
MAWLDRQSFLGANSDTVLRNAKVGLAGLGGGGSHVAQQLAHVGIGTFVLVDDDSLEDSNLNRLVGGRFDDIAPETEKFEIARRLILGINPNADIKGAAKHWQAFIDEFKCCDLIIGGLDSVRAKHELEGFCRRFMIPYIDMGMDVNPIGEGEFFVSGQVVLSMPGRPCLQCFGVVREEDLDREARNYGAAGGKPQVIWPNGVLASSAVGLCIQILTPWHGRPSDSIYLEYDGNEHTVKRREGLDRMLVHGCHHYRAEDTGDPGFDIRKHLLNSTTVFAEAVSPTPERLSWWQALWAQIRRKN